MRNLNEVKLREWAESRRIWLHKEYENIGMLNRKLGSIRISRVIRILNFFMPWQLKGTRGIALVC